MTNVALPDWSLGFGHWSFLSVDSRHQGKDRSGMSDINITVTDRAGRRCASSGSKWEPKMGYSRAVRSGNIIAVTGTVGCNADGTYSTSLADQPRRSLQIIQAAIEALGGKL